MTDVHDLGGQPGFGPVPYDPDEPAFHHDWERRAFGIMGQTLAATATRPGEFRYAIERLDLSDYFDHGYYARWVHTFELVLEEYGVLEAGAVDRRLDAPAGTGPAGRARQAIERDPAILPADRPTPVPVKRTVKRELAEPPQFSVGDAVTAPSRPDDGGHTRLPAYVTARRGTVARVHPAEVLPDSTAHALGERPQHVYCVAYEGTELWGDEAEPGVIVHVDLYESYLQTAEEAS